MYADNLFPLIPSEKTSEEYLAHYGVLGMKWGVRRNPQRAGRKSLKKLSKLDKKATSQDRSAITAEESAATARYKADRKRASAWTQRGQRKADRLDESARKTELTARMARAKATRYSDDAKRWAASMNKAFAEVKITDVSYDDRQLGKKYLLDILEEDKSK